MEKILTYVILLLQVLFYIFTVLAALAFVFWVFGDYKLSTFGQVALAAIIFLLAYMVLYRVYAKIYKRDTFITPADALENHNEEAQ